MRELIIINQPLYNRGDQAAHKALIRLLQRCFDLRITVLATEPLSDVRQFASGIRNVEYCSYPELEKNNKFYRRIMCLPSVARKVLRNLPEFRRYNRRLLHSDYVLCAPGGICMGGYKNWRHIWHLANAMDLKKKVGIYGRSIGPFYDAKKTDRIFTKRSLDILRHTDYLSLRDRCSQNIASDWDLSFVPTVDTAFAWTPDESLPEELSLLRNKKYIVFVPNHLAAWHPYFRKHPVEDQNHFYRSVLQEILSRGFDVVMLPQLFGKLKGDFPYMMSLLSDLDTKRISVISDHYDSDIQQAIIRSSSGVVGARYHSIIFAVNNLVPFVCLSYEHKMKDTLTLLNLETYSLDLKELLISENRIRQVGTLLDRILSERASLLRKLKTASETARQIALQAFSAFQRKLYGGANGES